MTYSEANRVSIRKYLGSAAVDTAVERAIDGSQSIDDGGSRTDNSTETLVLSLVSQLDAIETKLTALHVQVAVEHVDTKIQINAARGIYLLRSEGRRLVGQLADALHCEVRRDCFSPKEIE